MLGISAPRAPKRRSGPGQGVDTHVAHETTGRQGPIGHMVGTGVSEFKGNACVPPAPELADVDHSGLRTGEGRREASVNPVCGPQPLLPKTQESRLWVPPLSHPGLRDPSPLTPRSCNFMCRSQSLTPRRAS